MHRRWLCAVSAFLLVAGCEGGRTKVVTLKVLPASEDARPEVIEEQATALKAWLRRRLREDLERGAVPIEVDPPDRLHLRVPVSRLLELGAWIEAVSVPDAYPFLAFRETPSSSPALASAKEPAWIELPFQSPDGERMKVGALPVCDSSDVSSANPLYGPGGWSLSVEFTGEGVRKMDAFTRSHRGEKLAIEIDGVILSTPVIREPFSRGAIITGDFDQSTVQRLAAGIGGAPPARFERWDAASPQ